MSTQPIDLAEVASEVVRVMFEEGVNEFLATSIVMTKRKMDYGQGCEIAEKAMALAKEALVRNPKIASHVRWQARQKDSRPRPFSHAEATHLALERIEQKRDSIVA